MSKLIELDAAIAETWKDTGYSDPLNVMTAIRDRLEALPTVDAVPVRCKDCKFFYQMTAETGICELGCPHLGNDVFCSEGERKDGGDGKTD